MPACLTDEVITDLLEGRLTPEELAQVDRHMAQCSACRALVRHAAGSYFAEHPVPPDPAASDASFPPQEFDEYRVVRPLGRGSMGEVYLCQDTTLDRLVAIKFISAGAMD